MKISLTTLLLFAITLYACDKDTPSASQMDVCDTVSFTPKDVLFKGINFEGTNDVVGPEVFDPMLNVHANAVSIIPYGFVYNGDSVVHYNENFQWWAEKDEGVISLIESAHSKDLHVNIKPHIWLLNGQFTGNFTMNSETQWLSLEETYMDYILHFTDIADSLNCEMVTIGTEFNAFVSNRPDFWNRLIDSTRSHFSGLVTYAENWDGFDNVPFWEQLDFIGIDAYFPLSDEQTPSINAFKEGWEPHLTAIEQLQTQTQIPVIFTEFGYRSMDYCGDEPWDSSNGNGINLEAQQNAYQGLYETFWDKEWFEGGFVWKWSPDHANAGGTNNNRYTPQNKPAETTLQMMYE